MLPRFVPVLAALAVAAPLAAQGWQSLPAPAALNTGTPFFNNRSADGENCNLLGVVTGQAQANNCANQRPNTWLPYTGPEMSHFLGTRRGNAVPFLFNPGTFTFRQQVGTGSRAAQPGQGGDIAGANQPWGVFQLAGDRLDTDRLRFGSDGLVTRTFTSEWGFWIDVIVSADGSDVRRRSFTNAGDRYFALLAGGDYKNTEEVSDSFRNLTLITANVGQEYVIGMEDKGCRRDSEGDQVCAPGLDDDNQDVVVSFAPVPEPGTYALMATGLAVLGAVARRRRAAA